MEPVVDGRFLETRRILQYIVDQIDPIEWDLWSLEDNIAWVDGYAT